jgi:hypothetical protein
MNLTVCDICKVDPRRFKDKTGQYVSRVEVVIADSAIGGPDILKGKCDLDICAHCCKRMLGEIWEAYQNRGAVNSDGPTIYDEFVPPGVSAKKKG